MNTEKVEDLRKILPARTSGRVILSKIKELLHKYPQLKNVETLADAVYVELKSEGKKISRSYIGRVINHYCDTLQKVAVNTGNIVKDFKDEVSKKSRPRKGSPIKTEILKRLQNIKTRCIITPTFAQEVSYSIHEAMISQGFEVSRAYIVKVVKEHLKK